MGGVVIGGIVALALLGLVGVSALPTLLEQNGEGRNRVDDVILSPVA